MARHCAFILEWHVKDYKGDFSGVVTSHDIESLHAVRYALTKEFPDIEFTIGQYGPGVIPVQLDVLPLP